MTLSRRPSTSTSLSRLPWSIWRITRAARCRSLQPAHRRDVCTHLTLVKPGDVVIGVSSSYSHPSVVRAVAQAGATLVDTAGIEQFATALERESRVGLVVLTRLAVTYEIMPTDELQQVVQLAHDKGVRVYVDDAGGARVGPAIFDQPRTLQLGVDVVATVSINTAQWVHGSA